ncbi:hypothetical protein [Archangium violaceum]|uniref:hypothetical protein n=1 Tax=Archangium violaceum TaxID=83451 RepID=UPI0036DE6913
MSVVKGVGTGVARRVGVLAGWMVLLCAFAAHATSGFDWLATQQGVDGSYGGGPASLATPVQSTAEVLRAYQALGQTTALGFA